MRKQRFFDLNGFDVVFQLPAWILFSMLLTIPGTCFAIVIITRATIAKHAVWVLLGIAVLWIVTLVGVYLIVGALARTAGNVVAAIMNRPREGRPPMIIMPPAADTRSNAKPGIGGEIPWVLEDMDMRGD